MQENTPGKRSGCVLWDACGGGKKRWKLFFSVFFCVFSVLFFSTFFAVFFFASFSFFGARDWKQFRILNLSTKKPAVRRVPWAAGKKRRGRARMGRQEDKEEMER